MNYKWLVWLSSVGNGVIAWAQWSIVNLLLAIALLLGLLLEGMNDKANLARERAAARVRKRHNI